MSRGDAAADVTSSKADVEKDLLRILSCQAESVSACDVRHLRCEYLFLWYLAAQQVLFWQTCSVKCETAKMWTEKQWEGQIFNIWQGIIKVQVWPRLQAVSQGNSGEAKVYMQRCKDMLQRIPKDVKQSLRLHIYNSIYWFVTFTVHIVAESEGEANCELTLWTQTAYLSLMCYNFGVDTYNLRKYEDSTFWLR